MQNNLNTGAKKWVEKIHLSTLQKNRMFAVDAAKQLLREFTEKTPGLDTVLMRDVHFVGDIEAILLWQNEKSPAKSREGYLIAEQFRKFGMTNHDVWQVVQGPTHLTQDSVTV